MKLEIPKLEITPQNFFRQCGYIAIANPHKSGEISYARSLDPGRFYPRFHAYFEDAGSIKINLHLDAKKPSYEGFTAHSGEYDTLVVAEEAERIKKIAEKFQRKIIERPLGFSAPAAKNKKSLQSRLRDLRRRLLKF